MSTFTTDQLMKIRAYAHMLADEALAWPRVRREQREEATEALTRWLFDHRATWASTLFETPRRLIMPDDPQSPYPVVDRFFDEFVFDNNGRPVRRLRCMPRVDQESRNETR